MKAIGKAVAEAVQNWTKVIFTATRETTENLAKQAGDIKPPEGLDITKEAIASIEGSNWMKYSGQLASRHKAPFTAMVEPRKINAESAVFGAEKHFREAGQQGFTPKKEVVDVIKHQAAKLDIRPEEVDSFIGTGNFKGLRGRIDEQAKLRTNVEYTTALRDQAVEKHISKDAVNKIFHDSQMSWAEKQATIIRMIDTSDKIIKGHMGLTDAKFPEPYRGLKRVEGYITGASAKMGDFIRYSNEVLRNTTAAKTMSRMAQLTRMAPTIRYKLMNLSRQVRDMDIALGEQKAFGIRKYMEMRDLTKRVDYAENIGQVKIKANPELIPIIEKEYGVKLTYNDLKYANQKESVLRDTLKFRSNMNDKNYEHAATTLGRNLMDYDGHDIKYIDDIMKGDWVNPEFADSLLRGNYHPRVGNEKWREMYAKKNPDHAQEYTQAVKDRNVSAQMKFFEHSRTVDSSLALDENRLLPHEEFTSYINSVMDGYVRREGTRLINQTKFATLMPLGKDLKPQTLAKEHQYLRAVEEQWNANFNPKGYDETGLFTKMLIKYTRATVPLALASPRMWTSNSYQNVFTGGFRHGYVRELGAYAKVLTEFGKQVVLNPTKIKTAFDDMISGELDKAVLTGKDASLAKARYRYHQMSPGLHIRIDEDIKALYKGKGGVAGATRFMNALWELITFPFAASDKISRDASFIAAYRHGQAALEKYSKAIKKGEAPDEAFGKLAKELHLGTFTNGNDRDALSSILKHDDILRTSDEFLYQYAERSMNQEIFDYSATGQSLLKAKAKEMHPVAGIALTFTSWPMYFHELARGAFNAWKEGDKGPMTRLVVSGLLTYGATTYAMSEDNEYSRDIKNWMAKKGGKPGEMLYDWGADMAPYIRARSPGLSYLAFVEKLTASPAGILSPAVGAVTYPLFWALEEVSKLGGADATNDTMKFMKNNAKRFMKSDVTRRKMIQLTDVFREAGFWDIDLRDFI